MQVFGKAIETKHGNFNPGDPLPPEWTGKETIRQLREKFGPDAIVEKKSTSDSFVSFGDRLADIEKLLADLASRVAGTEKSLGSIDGSLAELGGYLMEIRESLGVGKREKKLNA